MTVHLLATLSQLQRTFPQAPSLPCVGCLMHGVAFMDAPSNYGVADEVTAEAVTLAASTIAQLAAAVLHDQPKAACGCTGDGDKKAGHDHSMHVALQEADEEALGAVQAWVAQDAVNRVAELSVGAVRQFGMEATAVLRACSVARGAIQRLAAAVAQSSDRKTA